MAEARKRNKPSKPKSKSKSPSFEIFKDEKGYYGLNGFDKLPDEQRRVDIPPEELRSYHKQGLIKNPDIFKDDPQFQDIWADDQHENLQAEKAAHGHPHPHQQAPEAPEAPKAPEEKDIDEPEVDNVDKKGPLVDAQKAQEEHMKEANAKAAAHRDEKNRPQTTQEIIEGAVRGRRTDLVVPRRGGSGSTMANLPALKHNSDLDYRAKKMREQALEDESEFNRREKIIAGKYDESMGYGAYAALGDAEKAASRQSYGASGVRSVNNENNRRQDNIIAKQGLTFDDPETEADWRMREALPKGPADLTNEGLAMQGKSPQQLFEQKQNDRVTAELNKRAKAGEDVAQTAGYKAPSNYQRPAGLDNPETVQEGTMGPYADFNSPARQRLREEKVGPFPKEEPRGRTEELRPWVKDTFDIEDPAPTQAPEPISELPPQDPFPEEPSEDFDPSMSENLTPFMEQPTTAPQDKGFLPPQLQPGYEPDMSKPVSQQIREGVNLQPTMMPDGSVKQQIPNQPTYLAPEYQKPDPSNGLTSLGLPEGGDMVDNIPTLEEDGQIVPKGQMPTPDGVSKLPYGPAKTSLEDPLPNPFPEIAQPQAQPQAQAQAQAPARATMTPQQRLFSEIINAGKKNGTDMIQVSADIQRLSRQIQKLHPAAVDRFVNDKLREYDEPNYNPFDGSGRYQEQQSFKDLNWKDQMTEKGYGVEDRTRNRVNDGILDRTGDRGPSFHTNPKYGTVGNADRAFKSWEAGLTPAQRRRHDATLFPEGRSSAAAKMETKRQDLLDDDMVNRVPQFDTGGPSKADRIMTDFDKLPRTEQAKRLGINHIANPF